MLYNILSGSPIEREFMFEDAEKTSFPYITKQINSRNKFIAVQVNIYNVRIMVENVVPFTCGHSTACLQFQLSSDVMLQKKFL